MGCTVGSQSPMVHLVWHGHNMRLSVGSELGFNGMYFGIPEPMVHLVRDGHMGLSVWSELGSNGMNHGIPESHGTFGTGWIYGTKCMEWDPRVLCYARDGH